MPGHGTFYSLGWLAAGSAAESYRARFATAATGIGMTAVPGLTKRQWPEHITKALGIPTVRGKGGPWQSTGDTTDLSWFLALCEYLGLVYPGERIRAMRLIVETAGGRWDQSAHSSATDGKQAGGNVRKEAFEELWRALHDSGRLDSTDRPSLDADVLTRVSPDTAPDAQFAYRNIRLRQGQPGFRRALLDAYNGRCPITLTDYPDVLEAAHIVPHAKQGTMDVTNGLLLRADLHTLFDLRQIAINTSTWKVVVNDVLGATGFGARLSGAKFSLPEDPPSRPSVTALDEHRADAGL